MKQQGGIYETFLKNRQGFKRPKIGLSDLYLDLCVEAGETFDSSFTVYSENGEELSGHVITTNDKVIVGQRELSGIQCEIPFSFQGKLAMAGEEHFGDFLLLTNGGEYNIPYCITVVPKKLWIDDTPLGTMEEFASFAREHWEKAREAFFGKRFQEVFLSEDRETYSFYHGLLKGGNRDVILDSFLQETAKKPPLRLLAHWEERAGDCLVLEKGGSRVVLLYPDGWGCVEGKIGSRDGKLLTDRAFFTSEDFEDGALSISVAFQEGQGGEDVLFVETPFQRLEIPVAELPSRNARPAKIQEKEPEEKRGKKVFFARLLRLYVGLRTGKVPIEQYLERSWKLVAEAQKKTGGEPFLELLDFQLRIVGNRAFERGETGGDGTAGEKGEAAEKSMEADGDAVTVERGGMDEESTAKYFTGEEYQAFGQAMDQRRDDFLKDPRYRNYYYYLMALYKRSRVSILEAAVQIRDSFEKNGNFYDFWLLLSVDRNYALDQKLQCESFLSYREKGENSPLLYLGLLDVLNRNPYYLENLDGHGEALVVWGIRHGYLSIEFARQFARLAMKEKFFKKNLLGLLIKLYGIRQDEAFLTAICSMLIKGNRVQQEYHVYFEQALARGLKIMGLNEYYFRSLDFNSYPILPKPLLIYFNYSNSLDAREKAYLYANILHYQKQYGDIYRSYLERMEYFAREQMEQGRINRYLKCLYEAFLPSMLEEKDVVKCLPNIIFKKKLTVKNRGIVGVYVCHEETGEEVYVPLADGACQVETYSEQASFYFADAFSNRYRAGISYRLWGYLDENKYREICLSANLDNKKVLLRWAGEEEAKPGSKKMAEMLLEAKGIQDGTREKAVEQLLDRHYEEQAMEELDKCLSKINYRSISPSYRRTLMNYYMACNRVEDAYFGIELYGSDLVDAEQLYLLTCVGLYLHKEERDELLLVMAHRTFINGRYNDEILLYLREHLEARTFDLLALWDVLKEKKMDTKEYEERLLAQMLFTGEDDLRMSDVLLSYLIKTEDDALASSMIDLYSVDYYIEKKEMRESFFQILARQAERPDGLSLMGKMAYLAWKADGDRDWDVKERQIITEYLDELCGQAIILPFFEAYGDLYAVPPLFREMTWIILVGEEKGGQMKLSIADGQGEKRQEPILLREICPGCWHGGIYLLGDEEVCEVGGRQKGEFTVFRLNGAVEGSRNRILSRMEKEREQGEDMLRQYESVIIQMKEQLVILMDQEEA